MNHAVRRSGLGGTGGWFALAYLIGIVGLLTSPDSPVLAQQQTADEGTALSAVLQQLGGVPTAQCPANNPNLVPCVALVQDPTSVTRGIAKFNVGFGPSQSGGYVAVYGRLSNGSWGYWFSVQDQQPELARLPGDLLACPGPRGAPPTLLAVDGAQPLAPLAPLRADRFVLAVSGTPPRGDAPAERGTGWYWVTAPRAGWVPSQEAMDATFGDCSARDTPRSTAPTPTPTPIPAPTATPVRQALVRQITLDSPLPGDSVASPADVSGNVTVTPFENSLVYRVYDAAGQVAGAGPVRVEGEMGQPGTYSAQISFLVSQSGPGRIEIADLSMADGSPLATAAVDVTLLTSTP